MKKLLLILIFCFIIAGIKAQDSLAITITEYFAQNGNKRYDPYLRYQLVRGNKPQIFVFCFMRDSMQIVVVGRDGFFIKELQLHQPNLFADVYKHYKALDLAKNHVTLPMKQLRRWKLEGMQPEEVAETVAIKYGELHYNHFRPITEDQIKGLKKRKLREAFSALNYYKSVLLKTIE